MLRRYVYGPQTDERLVQVDSAGTKTFFHTDFHGSSLLVSDASQTLTPFSYDPYGVSASPATGVSFRYTGRRLDPETGLYYYRARYYSPTLGRFLQTDPVGAKHDLNLYTYVRNDPLNDTDPTGEDCIDPSTGPCDTVTVTATPLPASGGNKAALAGIAGVGVATSEVGVGDLILLGLGVYAVIEGSKSGSDQPGQPADSSASGSPDPNDDDESNNSQHAQDRMKTRNVSQDRIDEAKRIGREKPGNTPNEVVKEVPASASQSGRGIRIVIDRNTGRVVTVIDKGSKFK